MKFSTQSWIYLVFGLLCVIVMCSGVIQDSVVDVLYGGFSLVIATMFYLK